MRGLHLWTAIGLCALSQLSPAAAGAADPNSPGLEAVTAVESNPFGRGRTTLSPSGAASSGEDRTSLQRAVLGADRHVRDNLSAGVAASLAYASIEGGDRAVGAGLQLMLRWHALRSENWSGFVELGSGPLWLSEKYPARTSRINFASEAGLGFTRRTRSGQRLVAGVRAMHVSNAGLDDHNPGHNSLVLYLGILTTE